MKNKIHKLTRYKNYVLVITVIISIITLTLNPTFLALKTTKSKPNKIATTRTNHSLKKTPLPSLTPNLQPKAILAAATQISLKPTPTTTPALTQTPIPTNLPTRILPTPTQILTTQTTNIIALTSTNTPIPTTSTNTQTITLQIQFPNSNLNTTLPLKSNENACDLLQDAKDQNKLTSLTFDDSYLSMMHSRYVKEINGYQNNWTFTVNGTAPLGCSLSTPQPNDTIIWKFN
jgi:hypothetical protein